MVRKSLHQVTAVLLVALACAVITPARAHAAELTTGGSSPIVKMWDSAIDWVHQLWSPRPVKPEVGSPWYKFGAGHTSDGHAVTKAVSNLV